MKEWKDLTLTDDYLFSQIMKDEDFCKLFLDCSACYLFLAILESIVLLSDFLIDA